MAMEYSVAIVEDDIETQIRIKEMLFRFGKENHLPCQVDVYSNGMAFVSSFRSQYDVVFMDIEMPLLSGMEASKEIRKKDNDVLIVFVTNLAQFAVEGYAVQAFDFVLKPLNYPNFSMKLLRIVNELNHHKDTGSVLIKTREFTNRIRVSSITYLDVRDHYVLFHLHDGKTVEVRASLSYWEEKLLPYHFIRCNSYTLVNLRYVTDIKGDDIMVHDEVLHFSRNKRTDFLKALSQYIGGTS